MLWRGYAKQRNFGFCLWITNKTGQMQEYEWTKKRPVKYNEIGKDKFNLFILSYVGVNEGSEWSSYLIKFFDE